MGRTIHSCLADIPLGTVALRNARRLLARPPVRRTGRLQHKVTPQKFSPAPVDRPYIFPSSSLLSRPLVYSSSHLCPSFSAAPCRVFAFIHPYVVCYPNGALLSASFFTFFSCLSVLLFIHHLYISRHTRAYLFVSYFLFSSIQDDSLSFLISYINFSGTCVYAADFFFQSYAHLVVLHLILSARVLCTLITSLFFLSSHYS